MLKFTFGGVPVEIWFSPSFNIKTTDKRIEMLFRKTSITTYDPITKQFRLVKPTNSELDAYLYLEELKIRVPELEIDIKESPSIPSSQGEQKEIILE